MKPCPSIKNKAEHISYEAIPVWDYVCKKYADDIYESKSLVDQWTTAKNHFHRLCDLKRVKPYLTYSKAAAQLDALTGMK